MNAKNGSPSVLRDLTAVAGLYRNVVWMFGQRVHRGPDWQEKLFNEAIRRQAMEDMHQRELVASRHN